MFPQDLQRWILRPSPLYVLQVCDLLGFLFFAPVDVNALVLALLKEEVGVGGGVERVGFALYMGS